MHRVFLPHEDQKQPNMQTEEVLRNEDIQHQAELRVMQYQSLGHDRNTATSQTKQQETWKPSLPIPGKLQEWKRCVKTAHSWKSADASNIEKMSGASTKKETTQGPVACRETPGSKRNVADNPKFDEHGRQHASKNSSHCEHRKDIRAMQLKSETASSSKADGAAEPSRQSESSSTSNLDKWIKTIRPNASSMVTMTRNENWRDGKRANRTASRHIALVHLSPTAEPYSDGRQNGIQARNRSPNGYTKDNPNQYPRQPVDNQIFD